MKFDTMRIGATQARAWLNQSGANRRLSPQHVKFLASEMAAGRWKCNGDLIRIGKNGQLLDGQHRLHAIIESGVSVEMAVVSELDPAVFDTIDRGKKRNVSDILHIMNVENSKDVSAAGRWILAYHHSLIRKFWLNSSRLPLEYMIELLASSEGDIQNSIATIKTLKPRLVLPSLASALHYLFSEESQHKSNAALRELSTEFWTKVLTGADLSDQSPELALRNRLVDNAVSLKKFTQHNMFALCVKAWNYRLYDRRVSVIKLSPTAEPFPIISQRKGLL
jgi:hypothetical protein